MWSSQGALILNLQQWTENLDRIRKETMVLNDTLDQKDVTDILGLYIPEQQSILSSGVHVEHSPRETTYWVAKSLQ